MKTNTLNPLNKIFFMIAAVAVIGVTMFTLFMPKSTASFPAASSAAEIRSIELEEAADIEYDVYVLNIQDGEVVKRHNGQHDVAGDNATAVASLLTTHQTWVVTGGPGNRNTNQDFACKALKVAGETVSYVLWHMTDPALKIGEIVIWTSDRWVSYYTGKSMSSLNNPPIEIIKRYRGTKVRVWMENIDCSNLPPQPPLATGN
mgnify:CR=1 FL=1